MPRRKTSIDCNHLLNFKSNISPDLQSSATASGHNRSRNNSHKQNKKKKYDPKKQQEARQEKWVRQKLNSSFYLHSSAAHSFVIARSKSNENGQHRSGVAAGLRAAAGKEGESAAARYLKGNGCGGVVDWEVVKIVKVQVQLQLQVPIPISSTSSGISIAKQNQDDDVDFDVGAAIPTCTICLDSFAAPRITKCGHIYCLPCILRHFHSSDSNSNSGNVSQFQRSDSQQQKQQCHVRDPVAKCPCCFNSVQLSELRPVQFVTVQPPHHATTMTFHKCHRKRSGIVPFLPFPFSHSTTNIKNCDLSRKENDVDVYHVDRQSQSRNLTGSPKQSCIRTREDANDIPSVTDPDASYCRYNYMDTTSYIHHLENDLSSLHSEMQLVTDLYKNFKASTNSKKNNVTGDLDCYFVGMAIEAVQVDHSKAVSCLQEQTNLRNEQESRYSVKQRLKVIPHSNHNDSIVKVSEGKEDIGGGNRSNGSGSNITMNRIQDIKSPPDRIDGNGSKSVSSTKNRKKKSARTRPRANSMHLTPGTMYLNDDCVQFYQAVDGQLCFLCGFNLKCLAFEFMEKSRNLNGSEFSNELRNLKMDDSEEVNEAKEEDCVQVLPPFPDILSGQVVDIRSVHITPEVQRRMPFTSHLPLYIDINLIELNLTQVLSPKTREHFRSEIEQRKKKRQSQRNSERRAKKKAEKEEMERIEKLKERIQVIDVNDEFFHASTITNSASLLSPPNHDGEDFAGDSFGPSLSSLNTEVASANAAGSSLLTLAQNNTVRSYGSVCASNGFFPALGSSSSEAFPSLSASISPHPAKENALSKQKNTNHASFSKKKAKDKVVLFSTGGRRGNAK